MAILPNDKLRICTSTIVLSILVFSMIVSTIPILLNSAQPKSPFNTDPINPSGDSNFIVKAPASPNPSYSGDGTPRFCQETLRGMSPILSGTSNKPLVIDLPGTGYWTGNRIDVAIDYLSEQNHWITNGDFGAGHTGWTTFSDPTHTGGAITLSADVGHGSGTQGVASAFNFFAGSGTATTPPMSTSTNPDNTGDVGSSTHWTPSSVFGQSPVASDNHRETTNAYSTGCPGSNNAAGAWEFYFTDAESNHPTDATQVYTMTFTATYEYAFNAFPVSAVNFQFYYRYFSNDFDQQSGGTEQQSFTLYYTIETATSSEKINRYAVHWHNNATNPGDSAWKLVNVGNLRAINPTIFTNAVTGNFKVTFSLVIEVDLNDWTTRYDCNHDTWCNWDDCYSDYNTEEGDFLQFYIDGVELQVTGPAEYGNDVNPNISQSITFDRRNTTFGYLRFYYFVPSSFLSGNTAADNGVNIEARVISDSVPGASYKYYMPSLTKGAWDYRVIPWVNLQNDIPSSPGPTKITVNVSIRFDVAGFVVHDVSSNYRSIWIDDVDLYLESYTDAAAAGLKCYDVEHGNAELTRVYYDQFHTRFSATGTWQTGTITSSTFWLNSTKPVTMEQIRVNFSAQVRYNSLKPTFSVAAEDDGLASTVVWTFGHNMSAIYSIGGDIPTWNYNLTIPKIPNWNANDWDVVNVQDAHGDPVTWQEIPTAGGFKNISIYTSNRGQQAQGIWTITCNSPNKITSFNVLNGLSATAWEYYPGGTNRSRVSFATGVRYSANSNITLYYLMPNGTAVLPQYFNKTIRPNTNYTGAGRTPYWNILTNAVPGNNYVAMVKWVDNDTAVGTYVDEVGFAAHYVQVKRNVIVSRVNFLQISSSSTSNIVIAGETLRISVDVTDLLIPAIYAFDKANITFTYPLRTNPYQTGSTTRNLTKVGNNYRYNLKTDGQGADTWIINGPNGIPGDADDPWMGITGFRNFTLKFTANSVYINGTYQTYQIQNWFNLIVDTSYEYAYIDQIQEQGQLIRVNISIFDRTYGHNPARTGIDYSDMINNRSGVGAEFRGRITDFYPTGGNDVSDTWNGTLMMHWALVRSNLTAWCNNDTGKMNDPAYQWNGTLFQASGKNNVYMALIKIPGDAWISSTHGKYYVNITTTFKTNEWGWNSEGQYMTWSYSNGPNGIYGDFDDHTGCLTFEILEARGFDTGLELYPAAGTFWWKDSSQDTSRLYIRYYNASMALGNLGFNSIMLQSCNPGWRVESYMVNYEGAPVNLFGNPFNPIPWNHVTSTTVLPKGTPDPHRENLADNTTWGFFYHDFNWTQIKLGLGTFGEKSLSDQVLRIHVTADILNYTGTDYKAAFGDFSITIKPNTVGFSVALKYGAYDTFLDANYYGAANITREYYWGDILNFTINAQDVIENMTESGLSVRYLVMKGMTTITQGMLSPTANLGQYTGLLDTNNISTGIIADSYQLYFQGIKMNHSIQQFSAPIEFLERDTWLMPENIAGVFIENSIYDYNSIDQIISFNGLKTFRPLDDTFRSVPNATIRINVTLEDHSPRHSGIITEANVKWILSLAGVPRLIGWINSSINGVFCLTVDLHDLDLDINTELDKAFSLQVIPYKANFESTKNYQYPSGSTWSVQIRIGHRPIILLAITPQSMTWSQSNWKYHPLQFVAMDPISGENISGCTINWKIEPADLEGVYMYEIPGMPGHYQVVFDTWPSLFKWISAGTYRLSAEITNTPDPIYYTYTNGWKVAALHDQNRPYLTVESEGVLGPLSIYFYILLGVVGAVVGGYYSYKSYKFLTTPYVIRKIEESIDKISKDKKIAAGVMKSRDHLIFLEATDLLKVVGVELRPPPEKKLPPVIEKLRPKKVEAEAQKIPELPLDMLSEELDKVGVRPEEKPIMLQQIKELGPEDRREFIQSLIGEDRYKELVEKLKAK